MIEKIEYQGKFLAMIVKSEYLPEKTTFLTDDKTNQQLGYIVGSKNSAIDAHIHKPIERNIVGTSELLLVKKGVVEVDIYNDNREKLLTRKLHEGDMIFLNAGGHGFRLLEDAVILEVKQGPYLGEDDKVRFTS